MTRSQSQAVADVNVLLALVSFDVVTPALKRKLDKILYDYKIIIPQIVWGEFISVLLAKCESHEEVMEYMKRFMERVDKMTLGDDPNPPATNEVIRIAHELYERSDVINDTDALILAHAIANEDVSFFITFDKAMNNQRVQEYIKNLVKNGTRRQTLNIAFINRNYSS